MREKINKLNMNEELKEQIPKLLLKLSESGNENNEDLEEAEWRKL